VELTEADCSPLALPEGPAAVTVDVSAGVVTVWCVVLGGALGLVDPSVDASSLEHAGSILARANITPNDERGVRT
jgi:hypothetical protein